MSENRYTLELTIGEAKALRNAFNDIIPVQRSRSRKRLNKLRKDDRWQGSPYKEEVNLRHLKRISSEIHRITEQYDNWRKRNAAEKRYTDAVIPLFTAPSLTRNLLHPFQPAGAVQRTNLAPKPVLIDNVKPVPHEFDQGKISRVEVIDNGGRSYTKHGADVNLSLQDGGKTLKVFIEDNPSKRKAVTDEFEDFIRVMQDIIDNYDN